MKNTKKIAILVACVLIAAGLALAGASFVGMDFDITQMNTMNYSEHTYDVNESFSNISIDGVECDVRILPSITNKPCTVVCSEMDKVTHTVEVKNDTLTIRRTDSRRWYEKLGVYWGKAEVRIYLAQNFYNALTIASVSGDVEVADRFSFATARVSTTSGDIDFGVSVSKELSVKTVSGDITVRSNAAGKVTAESTSGDVQLLGTTVQNSSIYVETVSGEIDLVNCGSPEIILKTTSGDITGEFGYGLLMEFAVDTVSGDVTLPDPVPNPYNYKTQTWVTAETVSGDVTMTMPLPYDT